jgi:phage tail-like protein
MQMGLDGSFKGCLPRKFRFMMKIDGVCGTNGGGDQSSSVSVLPPSRTSRPQISLKEEGIQHVNEIIYFPMKPEFKAIPLTLYEVKTNGGDHPVMEWLKKVYDPKQGTWKPAIGNDFKKKATLEMFDGCGKVIETWIYENAWPQDINWGELDMGATELVVVDIQLRYDRAYRQ